MSVVALVIAPSIAITIDATETKSMDKIESIIHVDAPPPAFVEVETVEVKNQEFITTESPFTKTKIEKEVSNKANTLTKKTDISGV